MGFYIFVMFSTIRDEMQYIEKNFIFMVFLAVKDVGTDVIYKAMQMRFLLFRATKMTQMVNISLREQFIHKYLQYSTAKLENCAPIKLCALRV